MKNSEYISHTSREFALYTCTSRAIPSVIDGLKNVQRIALWLLRNKNQKIKVVALGGQMASEKLYTHGDAASNAAISVMCGRFRNNYPLIEGHGQFGNRVNPSSYGAARYVEASRSIYTEAFIYKDLDLVPLRDNYDNSNLEPVNFLPILPVVLLNGISGVATAYSTEILPRKLSGLIDATQDALNEKKKIRGLDPFYERYDLNIKSIGPNQYEFSGKIQLIDHSSLKIIELPPGHSVENFRKKLIQMEEANQILSFIDRSSSTIDITIKFKRGLIKDWTIDKAIDFFKIKEKKTERIVVLDWSGKRISTYENPETVVREFVEWRLGWYEKRYIKLIEDASKELVYWNILKILFENGFTKKLGTFQNKLAMEEDIIAIILKKKYTYTSDQIQKIVNLPTYRWTKEFINEIDGKIKTLNTDINSFQIIKNSKDKLKKVFNDELENLKKIKF